MCCCNEDGSVLHGVGAAGSAILRDWTAGTRYERCSSSRRLYALGKEEGSLVGVLRACLLVMLLSNYGRDQVGESFEGSQAPLLHQQPLTDVSSPSSSLADRTLKPSDQMLACQRPGQERRLKPHSDQVLKCPRCESMNTKFCYYNNYSLTQPRHFCKNCKRYWTKGGALRNVPVGGGCRKNKRVKQRQHDHPPPATSDEVPAGGGGGASAMGNDGASSSGILQQDFPVTSGSSGLYEVHHKGSNGVNLPFDRVDPVPRIYSGGNPPISINWAGQMTGVSLGNAQQTYDASLLGLNLPGAIKQEPVHPADLTSIFDPSLSMPGHAPAPLNEGLSSYVPIDNFGLSGATGEVLWRFPQPKLVSLLEEGNEQENRHPLLDLEASGRAEKLKPKGKTSGESIQVSSEFDQQADSSSAEWQPTSDGFFENGGDTGYWGNGGWSSDLHQYGGTPATGNQLL